MKKTNHCFSLDPVVSNMLDKYSQYGFRTKTQMVESCVKQVIAGHKPEAIVDNTISSIDEAALESRIRESIIIEVSAEIALLKKHLVTTAEFESAVGEIASRIADDAVSAHERQDHVEVVQANSQTVPAVENHIDANTSWMDNS